jgi:hypothetical protein
MVKPSLVQERNPQQRAVRSLLVARISMALYFVALSSAILRKEPRELLVGVLIALVPVVIGPGLYRLVGAFAAVGAFFVTALHQMS